MKHTLFLSCALICVSVLVLIASTAVYAQTFTVALGSTQSGTINNPGTDDIFDIFGTLDGGIITPLSIPTIPPDGSDVFNIEGTVTGDIRDYFGPNSFQVSASGEVQGDTVFNGGPTTIIDIQGTTGNASFVDQSSTAIIGSGAVTGDLILSGASIDTGVRVDGEVNDLFLRNFLNSGEYIVELNGRVNNDVFLDQGDMTMIFDLDSASVGGTISTSNFEIFASLTICSDESNNQVYNSQNSNGDNSEWRVIDFSQAPLNQTSTIPTLRFCGNNKYVVVGNPGDFITLEQDPNSPSDMFIYDTDDEDGDGVNNIDEVLAETDPLRAPLSEPDIEDLVIDCESVVLTALETSCGFEIQEDEELTPETGVRIGTNDIVGCTQLGNFITCSQVPIGQEEGLQDIFITLDGDNFFDRGDIHLTSSPEEDTNGPVLIRTGGVFTE